MYKSSTYFTEVVLTYQHVLTSRTIFTASLFKFLK